MLVSPKFFRSLNAMVDGVSISMHITMISVVDDESSNWIQDADCDQYLQLADFAIELERDAGQKGPNHAELSACTFVSSRPRHPSGKASQEADAPTRQRLVAFDNALIMGGSHPGSSRESDVVRVGMMMTSSLQPCDHTHQRWAKHSVL
eukprot:1048850-Amphidinium_carterae.1